MSRVTLQGLGVLDQQVLLVGYGVIGKQIYQEIITSGGSIVAIVDDSYRNEVLDENVPFYQLDFLEQALGKHSPSLILVSATLLTAKRLHEITAAAKKTGIPIVIAPERAEFHLKESENITLRTPTMEDIFARTSLLINFDEIRTRLKGARVLVSGAGGSIGSRIALHSLAMGAESVGLLDRDDCLLHDIAVEMTGKMHHPKIPLYVTDIQFENSLDEVFKNFQPNIVIHAAAQKHVTTLEAQPQNALAINVLGTMNMLEKSEKYGVEDFINISTDKAASQENILGLTKFLAERLTSGSGIKRTKSVRFVNVLGSRASVMHTFRIQAQFYRKLTVRGADTTRFFMTNNEAASLSLSTLASREDKGTFVFDMGQPVRILDIASEISRAEFDGIEIEIEELLNGEVIHEQLFRPEEKPLKTEIENVLRVEPLPLSIANVKKILGTAEDIYGYSANQARETIAKLLEL